jgi:DNA-binding XRE family transcriptional regulator
MPAGELRVVREWLGLSTSTLARLMGVREDTVRRWETGRDRIPSRVREEIEWIEQQTAAAVDQLVTGLQDARDPLVVVYRDTEDLPADMPAITRLGPSWWRHVVARAVHEIPGVQVCYPDEVYVLPDDTRD